MDPIVWFAEETGLPMLEGALVGPVRLNRGAQTLMAGRRSRELAGAVAHLVGMPPESLALRRLLAGAAAGTPSSMVCGPRGNFRVLAYPLSGDRVRVVVAPAELAGRAGLEHRAATAEVAAGVSHEVANALSAILGWAQVARSGGEVEKDEALASIESSAQTARAAARRLLDAGTPENAATRGPVDLGAVANDVVRLLRPQAYQKNVRILSPEHAPVWVEGTSSAFFTIAWNLVKNAVEALPPGGTVTLTVAPAGERVLLIVADDGPGLSQKQRARVFEPYFTTKSTGTGLGLPLVKEAVESHGGHILLETEEGWGCRFTVDLPQLERPRARRPAARARSGVQPKPNVNAPNERGGFRALVVEDDPALRELIATFLGLEGADVTAVGSGEEAAALTGSFAIALIDVALPDQRGDAVLGMLRRSGRVGAAALVSGAAEPPDLDPDGRPDRWLRKPFEPADLLGLAAELRALAEPPEAALARETS